MTSARRSLTRSLRKSRRRQAIRNDKSTIRTYAARALRFASKQNILSPTKHHGGPEAAVTVGASNPDDLQGITRDNMSLHVNKAVSSLFDSAFEGATLVRVPIEQCVSIEELRGRPLTEWGVRRFEHILNGGSIGTITGHVAVGRKPIITPFPESYDNKVRNYFLERGRDPASLKEWTKNRKMFHVVDGAHEHAALWKHGEKNGYTFSDRGWWAICIEWQPANILKAMSRMTNNLQKKQYVVDYTTSDQILSFREVMEEVASQRNIVIGPGNPVPSGFVTKAVNAFAGGASYSNQTLSNLGPTVARMSLRLARSIKRILDEEVPEISDGIAAKKKANKVAEDSRVFRKLLNTQNIRCAKKFLSAHYSDDDRENALFRLRYIANESGNYKGVSHKEWDDQIMKALRAKEEIEKFKNMLGGDRYQEVVGNIFRGMLRTTEYDEDIALKKFDESGILSALSDAFVKHGGQRAVTRLEQYIREQRERENDNAIVNPGSGDGKLTSAENMGPKDSREKSAGLQEVEGDPDREPSSSPQINVDSTNIANRNSGKEVAGDTCAVKEDGHQVQEERLECNAVVVNNGVPEDEDSQDLQTRVIQGEADLLKECKVEVFKESWVEFMRMRMTEEGTFNFIILEPYQKGAQHEPKFMDEDEIGKLGCFVRKSLAQDGFCFIILPWVCLGQWKSIFQSIDLEFYSIFRMGFESESLQRIKGKDIRDPFEDALVFRRHTKKKANVKVNYPYSVVSKCSYSRRFTIIDRIPVGSKLTFRGSKMQVRTSEKSPALYWELMRTFCPPTGKVLDVFAGTMSVGIACIKSYRSCVLLEEDDRCFDLAVERLKKFASERLNNKEPVDLDEMSDRDDQCTNMLHESEDVDSAEKMPSPSKHVQLIDNETHNCRSEQGSKIENPDIYSARKGSVVQHGLTLLANSAAVVAQVSVLPDHSEPLSNHFSVEEPPQGRKQPQNGIDTDDAGGNRCLTEEQGVFQKQQEPSSPERTFPVLRRANAVATNAKGNVESNQEVSPSPSKPVAVGAPNPHGNKQKMRKVLTLPSNCQTEDGDQSVIQANVGGGYNTRQRTASRKKAT